jgi:ribosome assembly protein RRB1
MSKRSATEVTTTTTSPGQPFAKAAVGGVRRAQDPDGDMGEFEDAFEDEIESDEDAVDAGSDAGRDGMLLQQLIVFLTLNLVRDGGRRSHSCS